MTARTRTIIVALDDLYRDDDIDDLLNAISLLKGVLKAEILEENQQSYIIGYGYKQKVKQECYELMQKIWTEW